MIYLDNDSEYIIFPNLLGLDIHSVKGIIRNNVTNYTDTGYGTNSSSNPNYLKFVFQEGWLQYFPDNEYTVDLYALIEEEWIFIGKYLVQKGISTVKNSSVFENNTTYVQFEN